MYLFIKVQHVSTIYKYCHTNKSSSFGKTSTQNINKFFNNLYRMDLTDHDSKI